MFYQWQRRNGLIHSGMASIEAMGEGLRDVAMEGELWDVQNHPRGMEVN